MKALRTLLAGAMLAGFCTVSKAQMGMNPRYNKLIGKDISTAMQALSIKDTIGKTSMVSYPKIEKDVKLLALKLTNGDQLLFKGNTLKAVLPKQSFK